jgi:hypothetical protein
VIDCAALALLGAAIFALRRIRPPAVADVQGAFQDLDRSIGRFVPDIPPGYTWGEAMDRLKGAGVDVDWPRMESSLAGYEAFRYGGREMPKGTAEEAIVLSTQIRRKIVGRRSKAASTVRNR